MKNLAPIIELMVSGILLFLETLKLNETLRSGVHEADEKRWSSQSVHPGVHQTDSPTTDTHTLQQRSVHDNHDSLLLSPHQRLPPPTIERDQADWTRDRSARYSQCHRLSFHRHRPTLTETDLAGLPALGLLHLHLQ